MTDQPNGEWTKIPNALLDAMSKLGNAELRVLLAMIRKTAGWGKECDVISVSQLATATGLTSRNTQRAIESLLARGMIEREKAGKQTYCYMVKPYPLRTRLENHIPTEPVSRRDTEPYPLGTRLEVKPYPLGTTQKKDSKERKKEGESRLPKQVSIDSVHEGVMSYLRLADKKTLSPMLAGAIAEKITDYPRWEKVITAWIKAGHNPSNLTGMLDWYEHPERMENRNGTHQPSRQANSRSRTVAKRLDNRDD